MVFYHLSSKALSRADIFGHPITLNLELRSKY